MKKCVSLCLAMIGSILASISVARPGVHALHDTERLEQRDAQNFSIAISGNVIKSVHCEIAEKQSFSRCRSTCSASGISDYTPGVCGVGAKCSCVATVESPPRVGVTLDAES